MTRALAFASLLFYLRQVALHSAIMGTIFYAWAHHVRLPSGRTKRRLLTLLLVLPVFTALAPGRSTPEFRERLAWLDSNRLLAIPIGAGFQLSHVALLLGVAIAVLTIWQEVLPSLRRRDTSVGPAPERLAAIVRAMPGWSRCDIVMNDSNAVMLATGGRPGRPRLLVSGGALDRLSDDELATVVRHEHAHWYSGRWLRSHALFIVRLLQCHNPVALWSFREYCLEQEIACDAEAVSGRDRNLLIRPLLRIYESIDAGDLAARGALKKRVNVLLAGGPTDDALPAPTILAAGLVMLLVLPWLV